MRDIYTGPYFDSDPSAQGSHPEIPLADYSTELTSPRHLISFGYDFPPFNDGQVLKNSDKLGNAFRSSQYILPDVGWGYINLLNTRLPYGPKNIRVIERAVSGDSFLLSFLPEPPRVYDLSTRFELLKMSVKDFGGITAHITLGDLSLSSKPLVVSDDLFYFQQWSTPDMPDGEERLKLQLSLDREILRAIRLRFERDE